MSAEELKRSLLDHLAVEFATGNLRYVSDEVKRASESRPIEPDDPNVQAGA